MPDQVDITKSIFLTIKTMLGMEADYTPFDTDLVVHINTVLSKLTQVGVGPEEGFRLDLLNPITSEWEDFVGADPKLDMVKTYIYLSVRVLFDPPQNSFTLEALKSEAEELLWRLNVEVDDWPSNHEDTDEDDD